MSAGRPGQFKDDMLGRLRMSMVIGPVELRSLLRGRFHDLAIVVARTAVRARNYFHRFGPSMFLMASRAGTIFHHVRLVKGVMRVAGLTLLIDRFERDAVLETRFRDLAEFF